MPSWYNICMKKVVYIFILLAVPLSLNAYTFTRTMNVGSTGEDVRELQKFLNSNSATAIADIGPGSPGNESTYFGEKTKQAVIKMQNLYAPLILHPLGLTVGSGFVGNSTLTLLNTMTKGSEGSAETNNPNPNAPVVESVTPTEVRDGDTITITGKNFSDTNTVILGFEALDKYTNIKSSNDGTKIEIKYDSSIQKPYDKEFQRITPKAKAAVLKQFPKIPVAVSVIDEKEVQSNFLTINFNLK